MPTCGQSFEFCNRPSLVACWTSNTQRHWKRFETQSTKRVFTTFTTLRVCTGTITLSSKHTALGEQKRKLEICLSSRSRWSQPLSPFKSEKEEEWECAVLPPIGNNQQEGLILDYITEEDDQRFSHRVETYDGVKYKARIKVKIRETQDLIDPLDFRFRDGAFYLSWDQIVLNLALDSFLCISP